jgi:hypothetical protein
MARFFVAWLNPSNGRWEGINANDTDQAFDVAGGTAANSAAALQSGKTGLFAAFPIDGAGTASFTTAGPANSNIKYTAQGSGTIGNQLTIAYVRAGNNTVLSVAVSGRAITVNLATNGSGVATSTGTQVRDAVNAHAVAGPLVAAALATGNDGTGIPTEFTAQFLTGGTNAGATVESLVLSNQTINTPSTWPAP